MPVALVAEGLAAKFDTFEVAIYHSAVNSTTLG